MSGQRRRIANVRFTITVTGEEKRWSKEGSGRVAADVQGKEADRYHLPDQNTGHLLKMEEGMTGGEAGSGRRLLCRKRQKAGSKSSAHESVEN